VFFGNAGCDVSMDDANGWTGSRHRGSHIQSPAADLVQKLRSVGLSGPSAKRAR
jgi:hypothetical protein